jgi:Tfp pilus assembly protein PilF
MGDRAVYCARLESVCTARYQGFESPPIRHLASFLILLALLLFLPSASAALTSDLGAAARAYQQEKFDEAHAALDRFEKSSAPTAESLDLRGCIYLEQRKFGDAQKTFEVAHAADPDVFAPRLHSADLLLRQRKFAAARSAYQVLLKETNVMMANERLRFAVLLTYMGERDEASARQALDAIAFPTETPAYYLAQASWAFAHEKRSEGEEWVKKTKQVYEPEATAWFTRHMYELGWLKNKPPLSISHG